MGLPEMLTRDEVIERLVNATMEFSLASEPAGSFEAAIVIVHGPGGVFRLGYGEVKSALFALEVTKNALMAEAMEMSAALGMKPMMNRPLLGETPTTKEDP